MTAQASDSPAARAPQLIGLFLGLALALLLQFLPPPEGLSRDGWAVVSLAVLMAVWWATEAIPIPATALLPMAVAPVAGIAAVNDVSMQYMRSTVFLLLGGFIIAMAIQRWNLHARIALNIVARFGARPKALIFGFMLAAALLSMWISNTATTIMMTPIALSVAMAAGREKAALLAPPLLLGLAYAASVGGLGTPVGTPTNLLVIGWLQETGRDIGFAQWMGLGVPVVALMVPVLWVVLTRVFSPPGAPSPEAAAAVKTELSALGPMRAPERRVLILFAFIGLAWMTRQYVLTSIPGLGGLTDAGIAIIGALAFFLTPSGEGRGEALLDWRTAERLPWGVVILFGGGMSLAWLIETSGLAAWLGGEMSAVGAWPLILLILSLTALVIFATEMMSNIATVSALIPVFSALSAASGADPVLIAAPVAMAASCAFMLPVATGPNAVVFASGEIRVPQMVKAGFFGNMAGIAIITLLAYWLTPLLFAGG
ncbi:MAG: DASS family sodium-coupled anion symporter [Euryhalocaulis sp.]|uniref:SLC13 family permease n=1 Tax=Euryhalocaulis sp. TaxID=2744307 RepID=UPI001836700E|nr:DASS family sodium-coupled anion symporter [Euryhalocaulis sp.]MBA4800923.1 DASS family sodium-coupled anion symporter [Euryhalocaulis sp.]